MPKLTINNKADLAKLKKKMQKRIAAALDLPVRKTREISSAIRSEPPASAGGQILKVPKTGNITRIILNGEEIHISEPIPLKKGDNVHDKIRKHLEKETHNRTTN